MPDTATATCTGDECQAYLKAREALVTKDRSERFSKSITLNTKEIQVQTMLAEIRTKEILNEALNLPFQHNFRRDRHLIDSSALLPYLQQMPKGGILHTHSLSDPWFLVKNATYRKDCYVNTGSGSVDYLHGQFLFANSTPENAPGVEWGNCVALRQEAKNVTEFDQGLFDSFQFLTPENMTEDDMWVYFVHMITTEQSLEKFVPNYIAYIQQALHYWAFEDNIQHVELRGPLLLYDYDGQKSYDFFVKLTLELFDAFNEMHNTNLTIRFICIMPRNFPDTQAFEEMKTCAELIENVGDSVSGFDFVGQEDRFHTLKYYLGSIFKFNAYAAENGLKPLNFFFHSGETDWSENSFSNLYDAILLNTSRIGHGFALPKHPELMEIVKQKQIGIELCPISNQLLKLLVDMRINPAAVMMAKGLPVTISNDDPGVYGYTGLSYDFWEAYTSWNLTLADMKQLTRNSITYSSLSKELKQMQLTTLNKKWDEWIDAILSDKIVKQARFK